MALERGEGSLCPLVVDLLVWIRGHSSDLSSPDWPICRALVESLSRRVVGYPAWWKRQRPDGRGQVYFIEALGLSRIKIGFTARDPLDRLRALQTAAPARLRLLATFSADPEDERRLHGVFSDERVKGEWFTATPRLLAFVAGLVE
jgi:hypothetical protein